MKNILALVVTICMVAPAQDVSPSSIAQLQEELKLAIVAGNIEAIQSALNKGAPINGAFDERFNPLCLASFNGNLDVVKHLLKAGADINWLNEKSKSSLSAALFAKQSEIALYLIAQGCDLGSLSKDESNINLTYAAQSGLTQCVEILLKRGVPAEGMAEEGSMPLAAACQYGHTDIIRLLIKYGFDLKDPRHTRVFSPLAFAAYKGHFESLELFLAQGMDCNAMGTLGLSPIGMASQAGHADCVAVLLAHGADANAKGRWGFVPLVSAAQNGHEDCVDILLAHPGISIDVTGSLRCTALNGASSSHPELVQRILDAGGNPNIKDADGASPLLRLSENPLPLYQIAAIALIEAGADINARNDEGESPLLLACKENNLRLADILLALGADASPKDSTGRTARDYAREASRAELLALIDKGEASALSPEQRAQFIQGQREHFKDARAQARTQNELTDAIKADNAYLVEKILQTGAQINGLNIVKLPKNARLIFNISIGDADTDTDAGGIEFDSGEVEVEAEETVEFIISPLAYACALNNQKLIKLLLEKGADINQLIGFESSALSFAISYRHVDLARDLMKLGAKLQLSPGNDQRMLFSCLWQGNRELFKQLIKAGAQLDLESYKCAETFYLLIRDGKYQEAAELIKLGFDEKNAARIPIKAMDKSFTLIGDILHNFLMTQDDKGNQESSHKKCLSLLYFVSQSGKPHELADLIGLGALSNGDFAEQEAIVKALYQAKLWREMKTFAAGETKNGKNSIIIVAASLDSVDALRSCIVTGADINVKNAEGESALAILTSLGNIEALDLLLEHGADINSRTNAGLTPLIRACELGTLKVVKYLMEHGADIKATDTYGDDARLYALAAGHEEIVDYLDECAAK